MSGTTVGILELKARLSAYIRHVKAGGTVVILDRGTPVGRIVPVIPSVEARAQKLVEAGLVVWSGRRLTPIAPVARTRGQRMVADLLLEDRE
jgi:prevent-host-death family protein